MTTTAVKSTFKLCNPNGPSIPIVIKKFSDGMVQTTIPDVSTLTHTVLIEAFIKDSDGIIILSQLKDILDDCKIQEVLLVLKVLPFSRQDRRMVNGDSFSLKPFARMLNPLQFNTIFIKDPHSDVFPALIDNVRIIPQVDVLQLMIDKQKINPDIYDSICSPDGGSIKKAFKIATHLKKEFIKADKIRDTSNGEIVGTYIPTDIDYTGKAILIVDDCLDGGRTFTELAKKLKAAGASQVDLFITVGIFSYGLDCLRGDLDQVFCHTVYLENIANNEDGYLKYMDS